MTNRVMADTVAVENALASLIPAALAHQ